MRLTVGRKLWLGFAIVLVLLAAVAVLSVFSLSAARTAAAQLVEIHRVVSALDRSTESMLMERAMWTQYVATGDEGYSVDARAARSRYGESWGTVLEYGAGRQLEIVEDLQDAVPQYSNLLDWAVDSFEDNPQDPRLTLSQFNAADEFYSHVLSPIRDTLYDTMSAEVDETEARIARLLTTMLVAAIAAGILAFAAAVAAAYLISRDITRAATHLAAAAESISRGDLDVAIEVKTGDEMQDLAESLDRMRASLKAAVERLRRRRPAT
jgi:methyl-accepting chemotaxis protein